MAKGITRSLFADDLIIYGDLQASKIDHFKKALDLYFLASGQQVNLQKSRIFIDYDRVPLGIIQKLKTSFNIPFCEEHFFHLGAPIIKGRPKLSHFSYLLELINSRLALWQCKYISFAGRVTLVKSVISSIPQFVFRSCHITNSCISLMPS